MRWKSAVLDEWSRDKIEQAYVTSMRFGTVCSFSKVQIKMGKRCGSSKDTYSKPYYDNRPPRARIVCFCEPKKNSVQQQGSIKSKHKS